MHQTFNKFKELFSTPLHPFLFVLFPILFTFRKNMDYLPLSIILLPIILSFVVVIILILGSYYFFKDFRKSAISATILSLFFTSYQTIDEILSKINFILEPLKIPHAGVIFGVWALVIYLSFYRLKRVKNNINIFTQMFTLMTLVLLISPLFSIIEFQVNNFGQQRQVIKIASEEKKLTDSLKKSVGEKPDIYYFIFDRYAGKPTIEGLYKYNNNGFYDFLTSQGFFVASKATSNYPKTLHSLISSLNMSYLNFEDKKLNSAGFGNENLTHNLVETNKVLLNLKERGYKFFNVGPWWPVTHTNKNADKNYLSNKVEVRLEEYYRALIQHTVLIPIVRWFSPEAAANLYHFANHRETVNYEFSIFSEIIKESGPKFIFTHILAPHEPYVFDENCKNIQEGIQKPQVELYTDQLQCTNKKIEKLIKTLMSNKNGKPVIVLQADEGPHPMLFPRGGSWEKASQETLKEKFPILSAYYFPDKDYSKLYPEITPVNSFRVVLNKYFGASLNLLPDKNYIYPDEQNLYKFTDVTKLLK